MRINLHGSYGRLTQEGARMVAPRYLLMLAFTSLGFSGCVASLQDAHYAVVNKSRAEYAWYSSTSFSDRWKCGSDYAYGYKMGYYDASTGKGCVVPAVPPPCYWSTKYQCCEGQKHIQDWYRGYQTGVAVAQGSGYPSFHTVPLGPQAPVLNKDGCGACYAPSGCLCENVPEAGQMATEQQLPAIPHLSASQPQIATKMAVPVHQVSAVTSVTPSSEADLGLIGPVGPAFEVRASKTPSVRTADGSMAPASRPMHR
ncbi:MAG: hypothetical protein IT423_14665 [Pirellulaceae bacterium]|nr:hypothetical protein [Pirellulaceae bacterium]